MGSSYVTKNGLNLEEQLLTTDAEETKLTCGDLKIKPVADNDVEEGSVFGIEAKSVTTEESH